MNIYLIVGPPIALTSIFVIIFVSILKNPEKIDKWSVLYNKYKFWKDDNRERKIISKTLDYKITKIAKQINKESEGILPYGLRIKWKKPDEIKSYIESNEVVVVLRKDDNSDKNIVDACSAYVPKALLPKARNSIDETLLKSIDQYVIKKILSNGSYDSSYNYFIKNVLPVIIQNHPSAKFYYDEINKVDSIGFFTRILLEEFRRLGKLLYGTLDESLYTNESIKFLDYLYKISKRRPGERTELCFIGDKIKIAVMFVAQKATLEKWGINAHINRIEKDLELGIKRLYVFSYAYPVKKIIYDKSGYAINYKTKKTFKALSQLEKECKKIDNISFTKKQLYFTKDVGGKNRKAKYILFQTNN